MLQMTVDSIRVSLTTQQRVIILKESIHELYIPIWIGSYEAESIVVALQHIEVSRPQTHDLMKMIIEQLSGNLKHVELVKIQDDTFYSCLVIENEDEECKIDCRPSDAISLAVRCDVPIYIHEEVLFSAGIRPESDIRRLTILQEEHKLEIESEYLNEGDDLSLFDDFLKNIQISDDEDEDSPLASV